MPDDNALAKFAFKMGEAHSELLKQISNSDIYIRGMVKRMGNLGEDNGAIHRRLEAIEGQKTLTADSAEMFLLLHRIWDSEVMQEAGWEEVFATVKDWCTSHPNPGYPT